MFTLIPIKLLFHSVCYCNFVVECDLNASGNPAAGCLSVHFCIYQVANLEYEKRSVKVG